VEVDCADVIRFKEERLSNERSRCRLERVAPDLADHDARRRILATVELQSRRMVVLTEGVISYLSFEEVGFLADDLRTRARLDSWTPG